jgi:hypothetical protein
MIESRTDGLTQIQLRGDQTRYYLINPLHDKLENLAQFGVASVELIPSDRHGPGYTIRDLDGNALAHVPNPVKHKTVVSVSRTGYITWNVYLDDEYRDMFVPMPETGRRSIVGGFSGAAGGSSQIVYNLSGSQP